MFWLHEFLLFGLKEARACVFAGGFFAILVLSRLIHVPGLPRYDFILLCTLGLQALLLALKVETWDEVKTLSLFHVAGLLLELFKTHPAIHSWAYPDQRLGWRPVSFGKVHSWTLLVILSFVLVADLKVYKAGHRGPEAPEPPDR